jgi:radical SAM superfamily enzyme YgiQ (UPF0313 family)
MRILLINPWIVDFAAYDFWIKPLGLLSVGAFLKERGHEIGLIDCMDRFQPGSGVDDAPDAIHYHTGKFHREFLPKPPVLTHVPRNYARYGIPLARFRELAQEMEKPDVVLVTSVMTYWYPGVFEAIREIRNLLPGIPVVLGGIYAALCEDHARENSGADLVIPGGNPREMIAQVESLCGKTGTGDYPEEHFAQWPDLPWDLYENLRAATVMTTRGCPFHCTACASRFLFGGYERKSPERAAAEIISLAGRGVEDIAFGDDALLLDSPHHAAPLFELLSAEGVPVRLHTPNGLHVREITPELAHLMKKAGMATVRLRFAPKDLGAYILAGLPGQTFAEVEDSIAFSFACGVPVRPALFSPVPHTVEFERAVAAGLIDPESDPLLQNNTLRAVDWFAEYPGGYKGFKRTVDEGNESLQNY